MAMVKYALQPRTARNALFAPNVKIIQVVCSTMIFFGKYALIVI